MKDKHPIDHAKALRDAKREVRKQANWQHPFFWAPFSLMGPH
jgi:CHAT domain-containing protein